MSYFVYIIYSPNLDKYYVGQTDDIHRRLEYHNDPIESRKFSLRGRPWTLTCRMEVMSRTHALKLKKVVA
jgi:putative endonuclease